MFTRIMAVVMTAIILTTVCLTAVSLVTLRNQQINARLDYLIAQAEDIAYLASDLTGSGFGSYFQSYAAQEHLNAKADKVNREFGA